MRILDKLLTRRRNQARFSELPTHARRRLAIACQELSDAEQELAAHLGLLRPPRLLLVDEEGAVVLSPGERAEIDLPDVG